MLPIADAVWQLVRTANAIVSVASERFVQAANGPWRSRITMQLFLWTFLYIELCGFWLLCTTKQSFVGDIRIGLC